jgi:hypothetical protein
MYLWYTDPNTSQWVIANNFGGNYLALTGGTMTGPLLQAADPVQPLGSATKQYVDATNIRYRNRIINGDMACDQRHAGSTFNAQGSMYAIDRWKINAPASTSYGSAGQNYNSDPIPAGLPYCLIWQTLTTYTLAASDAFFHSQIVETYNIQDINWGLASGQPATLEFVVKSSLTGLLSGVLRNPPKTRCYVFTYTVTTANVWQKIRINIPADLAGAGWNFAVGNPGTQSGLEVDFTIAAGATLTTSTPNTWITGNFLAATGSVPMLGTQYAMLFITGVALMVGSAAQNAEPEFKKYSENLADCQRYYSTTSIASRMYYGTASQGIWVSGYLPAVMRAAPTLTFLANNNTNVSSPALAGLASLSAIYVSGVATAVGATTINVQVAADADF